MANRRAKAPNVDPDYLERQKASLKRVCRMTVLFNSKEMSAIDEYCRRFKINSRSTVIRQAAMERILSGLDENHPTLF